MANADMTTTAGILKTVYPQKDIKRVGYRNKPFFGMVKKRTDMSGDHTDISMRYASQLGASNDFATAQASKNPNAYAKFQLTSFEDYALGGITTKTLRMARDKGAIVEGLKEEMEGLSYVAGWRLAAALYKNGGGAIGVIKSGSGTTAITLTEPNDIIFFQKGQKLDGATTDGTSGAVIAGGVGAVVSAIDADLGILTSTGAVNWSSATAINGVADGNFLFSRGDFGIKLKGLDVWLPATPGGTLFNVNRSVDTRLSGCRVTAQANIEETLLWAMERAFREGGMVDAIFMNSSDYRALIVELGSKKFVYSTGKATDVEVGYKGIVIQGIGSEATVYPDPYCPKGTAYALQMDTWTLWSAGDAVGVLNDDGNKMLRDGSTDSIEIRMGGYTCLGCDAPWMNCRIALPLT